MYEDITKLERSLDSVTHELYDFGPRIEVIGRDLRRTPFAGGWRWIGREIAQMRWRFLTAPAIARRTAAVLNAAATCGPLALVVV